MESTSNYFAEIYCLKKPQSSFQVTLWGQKEKSGIRNAEFGMGGEGFKVENREKFVIGSR